MTVFLAAPRATTLPVRPLRDIRDSNDPPMSLAPACVIGLDGSERPLAGRAVRRDGR